MSEREPRMILSRKRQQALNQHFTELQALRMPLKDPVLIDLHQDLQERLQ